MINIVTLRCALSSNITFPATYGHLRVLPDLYLSYPFYRGATPRPTVSRAYPIVHSRTVVGERALR